MCDKPLASATGLLAYFQLDEGSGSAVTGLLGDTATFVNMATSSDYWTAPSAPVGDVFDSCTGPTFKSP